MNNQCCCGPKGGKCSQKKYVYYVSHSMTSFKGYRTRRLVLISGVHWGDPAGDTVSEHKTRSAAMLAMRKLNREVL